MKIGKFIKSIFEKCNICIKSRVRNKEKQIISEWKKHWDADIFQREMSVLSKEEESDCFYEWLITTMTFFEYKIRVNRMKNGLMKAILLFFPPFIAIAVSVAVEYIWGIKVIPIEEAGSDIKNWILFGILVLWFSYIISKWISVKKYQETWARYTRTKGLILCEMVRYIYQIGEYNSMLRKPRFIEKILAIVNKNIDKFHDNMTQKEETIFSLSELGSLVGNKDS